MRNLYTGVLCLLCFLASVGAEAQSESVREPDYNKPRLFQQLPQRMNCRMQDMQNLLHASVGQEINITLADNFNFQGVVSSAVNKEGGRIITTVVRSTNYPGAVFSFSKVKKEDGSSLFVGRIISFQHGDGYEIAFENGQYVMNKKGFYDMVNE